VLISFFAGLVLFKQRKSKMKFVALLGVILGICLIALGK
jgi:transporter family protein